MKTLLISRQTIRENLQEIRKNVENSIYVDLSGDAFGMGLTETAKILREDGIRDFAVSDSREAAKLRNSGFTDEKILILRSVVDREELEKLMDLKVIFSVGSPEAGVVLNGIADKRGTVAEVLIKVDTGMGSGFNAAEMDKIFSVYRYMANLAVVGVTTDIGESGGSKKKLKARYDLFEQVLDKISSAGFETGETMLIDPFARTVEAFDTPDTVVIGAAIAGGDGLKNACVISAAIEEVKWMPKGSRVGGKNISGPRKIAVIPVGTFHGLGAGDSGRGRGIRRFLPGADPVVRISGTRARIVGKPSLFSTAVDITNVSCGVGDIVSVETDALSAKGLDRSYS